MRNEIDYSEFMKELLDQNSRRIEEKANLFVEEVIEEFGHQALFLYAENYSKQHPKFLAQGINFFNAKKDKSGDILLVSKIKRIEECKSEIEKKSIFENQVKVIIFEYNKEILGGLIEDITNFAEEKNIKLINNIKKYGQQRIECEELHPGSIDPFYMLELCFLVK